MTTPRAEFWEQRWTLGRTVRRMIDELDPEREDAEITHLSLEVLTSPFMSHLGYVAAAARTVAVPRVADRVFRDGKGDQIVRPWERDADTLTFFGELMRRGHRSRTGIAACEQIQQIHRSVGGILNEDQIYTLAVQIFFPDDLARAMGHRYYSEAEQTARLNFWLGIGRAMRVREVPETEAEFRAWMREYEEMHFEPSEMAHFVAEAHIRAIEHWFPVENSWIARNMVVGLLEPRVAKCLGFDPVAPPVAATLRAGWRATAVLTPLRPVRLSNTWVDAFSRIGPDPDLERIGYGSYGRPEV